MANVTVDELLLGVDDILCRVEQGEFFTIFRNGVAVANLIPSQAEGTESIRAAIKNIQESKKHTLSDERLAAHRRSSRK